MLIGNKRLLRCKFWNYWEMAFLLLKGTEFSRQGSLGDSDGKESTCNAGDPGSIPESERSLGEGNGNPPQYSWLKNPWIEEPGGLYSQWGCKESAKTEHLTHTHSEAFRRCKETARLSWGEEHRQQGEDDRLGNAKQVGVMDHHARVVGQGWELTGKKSQDKTLKGFVFMWHTPLPSCSKETWYNGTLYRKPTGWSWVRTFFFSYPKSILLHASFNQ